MDKPYIMAIDQGTAGTRVILFDRNGEIHFTACQEIGQIYPHPGWVEHDPMEYWNTVDTGGGKLTNEQRITRISGGRIKPAMYLR